MLALNKTKKNHIKELFKHRKESEKRMNKKDIKKKGSTTNKGLVAERAWNKTKHQDHDYRKGKKMEMPFLSVLRTLRRMTLSALQNC